MPILQTAKVPLLAVDPERGIDARGDIPGIDIPFQLSRRGVNMGVVQTAAPIWKPVPQQSGEIKTIQVHHLVPGRDEVLHELLP
jgi:hypothetical protein